MAGKSLGTLTIDLIAKTGGFVSGMDKAERSSDKWRKNVESNAKAAGVALIAVTAAAVTAAAGVAGAGVSFLKTTSSQIAETDRWAKSLNVSTQELLAWQFAAEKAGLTGDNIADIFKDIGDKIGDAVLNKSGEAVDALNALGLSAEKLSKISPDKQLLAIGEALDKISTNAEKTTILESLGNDLSKMLPLFDNNNEKLKQFINQAKDYGVAPNPDSIDNLVKVNQLFEDMEAQAKGLKMEIASGLAKVDLSSLLNAFSEVHNVLTDPKVLSGLVDLIGGIAEVATWLVKAAAAAGELASFSNNRMKALGGNVDLENIDQVNERISYLENNLSKRKDIYSQDESMFAWLTGGDDSVKALTNELNELIIARDKLSKPQSNLPVQPASVAPESQFKLNSGETNGKTTSSVNKLENAYKSLEQSYLRQIELIDTTGKKNVIVTEQQKLSFDLATGKLTGLNEVQKKRLEQLAAEVDSLNAVKKANEDNLKVAEFVANLNAENQNSKASLNIEVAGGWLGDKERERMQERLSIQSEFLSKQSDLQKQYQSGDISQSLYDRETEALNAALEERLKIQEDHYKAVDELQNNGTAGFVSGLATQIEASMNLYSNMQQVGAQAFSSLTDMIVEWAETGKLNAQEFSATFLQSVGTALISYAAAQVAMAGLSAFTSMIGIPYIGPAVAPGAAIAAAAAAGVLAVGVGSALKGQAHDGIDSVPETGTWLLQKGERVTTAQTSAKLDATLDRVASSSVGGVSYAPVMHFNVNGDPSAAQIAMMKKAAQDGAELGYQKSVNSIATRQGDLYRLMMGKTNAGVKKR
ncbi:TPA: phage tail tape measure protein [Klebsiella michiganensis]